jgi:hypothetical protein
MAKLQTKREVVELAKSQARVNPTVLAVTLADLEGQNYVERRTRARLILEALPRPDAVPDRLAGDFLLAFVDRAMEVWGGLERERRAKREQWQRALSGIGVDEATAKVAGMVEAFRLRGARVDGLTVYVNRGWACEATLYVRFDRDDEPLRNFEAPEQRVFRYTVHTELSWSGTTRTLAESVCAAALYRELTEVAAEVESVMARQRVREVWGLPTPTPAAPEADDPRDDRDQSALDAEFAAHRAADPHCTCNDCVAALALEQQMAQDAAEAGERAAGWDASR